MNRAECISLCVENVRRCLKDKFILIGGASMMFLGSQRATNDIDILVSSKDVATTYSSLIADKAFSNENGQIRFRHAEFSPTLDILTLAVEMVTFEHASQHSISINQIRIPRLDYSLGMKIQCFYLRQDDENGVSKRKSDLEDIKYLCKLMDEKSEQISDECGNYFKFGHYHLLLLRQELGENYTAIFIRIGGRNLSFHGTRTLMTSVIISAFLLSRAPTH
ncbi:hypothetical protein FQN57_004559 [Myotisia sp. PD_48]|nr:hypothetical protein FQN57_004559 [Myotisia sp. PD_48]